MWRGFTFTRSPGNTWARRTVENDVAAMTKANVICIWFILLYTVLTGLYNTTCFYVSAPIAKGRANVTMLKSCGPTAPDVWGGVDGATVVDPGSSSYSSILVRHRGTGAPKLYDLWAWSNSSQSPNHCIFGGGGLVPHVPAHPGNAFPCAGGIRYAEVGFAPCGTSGNTHGKKC